MWTMKKIFKRYSFSYFFGHYILKFHLVGRPLALSSSYLGRFAPVEYQEFNIEVYT